MHILIVTTSDTQYDNLCLLLQTIASPLDCAHAITLEAGAVTLSTEPADLVLIDLVSVPETSPQLVEWLRRLQLEAKTVFVTDVAHWHEWRRGPWVNQVLVQGFSAEQLRQALTPLTRWSDKTKLASGSLGQR